LKSTCKNSGTFEGKRILPEKVTYVHLAPGNSIDDNDDDDDDNDNDDRSPRRLQN